MMLLIKVPFLNVEAEYKRGMGSRENGVIGSSMERINGGKEGLCSSGWVCVPHSPTAMLV